MNQADNQASNSALMLSQGRLAAHFTRAEQLQIMSPEGAVLATLPNPAAGEGCSGKQALLAALKAHRVSRVLVRNLGERMLGRLLASGLQVMQYRSARLPWPQLLASSNLLPLTQISQGRPSRALRASGMVERACCSRCQRAWARASPAMADSGKRPLMTSC